MPDEKGNLIPGDEGYIAPVEVPAVLGETTPPAVETPPEEPEVVETPESVQEATAVVPDPPTQAQYLSLLGAYKKLKVRVGLDPAYEKILDSEAGV